MAETLEIYNKYCAVAQCREWVYDADEADKEFRELRARIAQLERGLAAQTQRGDAYCDRLEKQGIKMDALTAENQRLQTALDAARGAK